MYPLEWHAMLTFLWKLIPCCALGGFTCDLGAFENTRNVAPAKTYLASTTRATRVSSTVRCTTMCLEQPHCRSVVHDQSSYLCYLSSVASNLMPGSSTTNMTYAVLKTLYCDYSECSRCTQRAVLPSPRVIYSGCVDARQKGNLMSGPYLVDPDGAGNILVWCDFTNNESWTVIQRRLDGTVNFYRGWTDYRNGFGSITGEYWLGLEHMHRLTRASSPKLSIYLDDFTGQSRTANYTFMKVADEAGFYMLTLGNYSGDAGDSMGSGATKPATGMKFTTLDSDNDLSGGNCAANFKGAWWYKDCHSSNLNGLYLRGSHFLSDADGVEWSTWLGYQYSLRTTILRMAV